MSDIEEGGRLLREIEVPARQARAADVDRGQVLQIIDLEGRQVGDLAAYMRASPDEYMSPAHWLSCITHFVPQVGEEVFSNHRRPLMRILRDDVGTHDIVVPCCDPERFERDYGVPEHPSCLSSLQRALVEHGSEWDLRGEVCWNVFMNNRHEEGSIVTHEPEHGAGAAIDLEVLEDLTVVLSACPQDLSPCNAYDPTPMAMRIWERS